MNWRERIRQWDELESDSTSADTSLPAARSSSRRRSAPASESQVAETEKRLGIALPPSFRSFLLTSNGLRIGTHEIKRIWAADELKWFRFDHRDWIKAYTQPLARGPEDDISDEEYFSYGAGSEFFRRSHLKELLQISDVGDTAVYLLNPQVISKDGKWEAWFFANWIPGAQRYRSFAEMMDAEFHRLARLDWQQPVGAQDPLPDEYVGSPGSAKRRLKQRKKPREAKVLGKRLSSWSVDELLAMLARDDYGIIHNEAIHGLRLLGDQRAVEPLLAKVRQGNVDAMHAVKSLAPELLPDELLELLRRRPEWGLNAIAGLLGEFKDTRALPLITDIVTDLRPEMAHVADYIGQDLVAFGRTGVDALIALLQDDQPTVRRRAAAALLYATDVRVPDALRSLLRDPDKSVREYVEHVLQFFDPLPIRAKKGPSKSAGSN